MADFRQVLTTFNEFKLSSQICGSSSSDVLIGLNGKWINSALSYSVLINLYIYIWYGVSMFWVHNLKLIYFSGLYFAALLSRCINSMPLTFSFILSDLMITIEIEA